MVLALSQKTLDALGLKYVETKFCLLFYMGVNLVCHISKEHRVRMFENGMFRKIFWPKRHGKTGG
jgi:hypothetical protein